ncbi:hypothetical protein ACFQ3B_07925 [Stackebrandtia endophytica]|uniref:hypothetical protein n=1 Tax=Stackebrandtia endophytica TaxID=1496996 RepID=UPI001153B809|nr:hypothetical protein [Stackebrandtia endophytica]
MSTWLIEQGEEVLPPKFHGDFRSGGTCSDFTINLTHNRAIDVVLSNDDVESWLDRTAADSGVSRTLLFGPEVAPPRRVFEGDSHALQLITGNLETGQEIEIATYYYVNVSVGGTRLSRCEYVDDKMSPPMPRPQLVDQTGVVEATDERREGKRSEDLPTGPPFPFAPGSYFIRPLEAGQAYRRELKVAVEAKDLCGSVRPVHAVVKLRNLVRVNRQDELYIPRGAVRAEYFSEAGGLWVLHAESIDRAHGSEQLRPGPLAGKEASRNSAPISRIRVDGVGVFELVKFQGMLRTIAKQFIERSSNSNRKKGNLSLLRQRSRECMRWSNRNGVELALWANSCAWLKQRLRQFPVVEASLKASRSKKSAKRIAVPDRKPRPVRKERGKSVPEDKEPTNPKPVVKEQRKPEPVPKVQAKPKPVRREHHVEDQTPWVSLLEKHLKSNASAWKIRDAHGWIEATFTGTRKITEKARGYSEDSAKNRAAEVYVRRHLTHAIPPQWR